jgi:hypothetical protein
MPEPLKPQDVVVALKLSGNKSWTYPGLARELCLSVSTVHAAIERLTGARLYIPLRRRIARADFLDFLQHGVRYAFPAVPGAEARGMSTASSAPPLSSQMMGGSGFVWASDLGTSVGREVQPLYEKAPAAAIQDPELHQWLALVDAMRVGSARERELAANELRKRLA